MRELIRFAELIHCPLLAEPWAAACVIGVLGDRLGYGEVAVEGDAMAAAALADVAQLHIQQSRQYSVEDGVAIVPVLGSLTDRSRALQPQSGLTGYSAIAREIGKALADSDVGAIALDIHSPGGAHTGNFELAARIREASQVKPVWAIVAGNAFSAAYSIAAAAQRIAVPATGMVGSIGVITAHVDLSAKMAVEGRKVTIIKAGARKADGNPFEALPPDVVTRLQAKIDRIYGEFVDLVARHRSVTAQSIRATEAETMFGADAVPLGLADAVMSPAEALAELKSLVNRGRSGRPATEKVAMTTNSGAAAPATSAELAEARAAGHAEGLAQGRAEGARLARDRIAAILDAPEAVGREATARALALKAEMEAPAAIAILGTLPKAETAKTPATDFGAAMAGLGNPQVGADDGGGSGDEIDKLAARIASYT